MYPLFPSEPASIVELGCFRTGKVLIFDRDSVGFKGRWTAASGGFRVATLGLDVSFLKGWDMRLVRSLGVLVLMGSVSWMLGCTPPEGTAGPGGVSSGSGVAGGADVPHSHEGEDTHAHEADAPKVEEPAVEEPKVEEPAAEEPKVEAPAVEEPKVEEPAADAPKSE